jgi:hypothetical protein
MNSAKKNEIAADDDNSRVLKTREAAALALKELDQSRSAHQCVLHLRGVGRITAPASILFARESRFPSTHNPTRENHRQANINLTDYMKSPHFSSFLKSAVLIATLALCFGGTTVAQPGDRDPLFPGAVRPGLDHRNELSQGYLTVYSATDQFDDGGLLYYAHSSYSIYTTDGKFFKNVENHISRSDEIPALVTLPTGSYTIEARSESRGYVRVPIVINAGRRTVLDPDQEHTDIRTRLTRTKHSRRLVDQRFMSRA